MIPFIATYSPSTVPLIKVIKDNFNHFKDKTQLLQDHRIIAAYRKNKNLRDQLVKAKVKALHNSRSKGHGEFFQNQSWVRNQHNRNVFPVYRYGSVYSKNCVYLIRCKQCGMQYVGETQNSLLTRFTQHKYNIGKKNNTHIPLVKHFINHSWSSLVASILQCNPRWSTAQRRRAERLWINQLGTLQPLGLNVA